MTAASSKRKREDDHEVGLKSSASKKAAKNGRRSLQPLRQYSVDDFANYLREDGTMNWDLVLDSFRFDIQYVSSNQKKPQKIAHGTETFHFESEADESLNVEFIIQPVEVWRSMSRYRKFTISGSAFQVDDYVLVSYDGANEGQEHAEEGDWPYGNTWPAKILKVIAGNESHVYLLVNYFFRPEDIEPGMVKGSKKAGRQPYHSRNEVIASNWLEIVDAKTVASKVKIRHWDEDDDEDFPETGTLFWRQHLNYATKTKQLSSLKEHCICDKPSNPDKRLIQCDNEACKKWMHEECLIDEVVNRLCKEEGFKRGFKLVNGESNRSKAETDVMPFTVILDGRSEPGKTEKVMIYECKGPRDGIETTWMEDVKCPFCQSQITYVESEAKYGEEVEDGEDGEDMENGESVMATKEEGAS